MVGPLVAAALPRTFSQADRCIMRIAKWLRFGAFACVAVTLIVVAFYAGRASLQYELIKARGDATSAREALARAREEIERTKAQYEKTLKWERIRLGEEADKWERDRRMQGYLHFDR